MVHISRKILCMLLAALTLMAMFVPAALAAGTKCYFNCDTKVYAKANRRGASLRVEEGLKVTLMDIDGDIAEVRRDGITAYCYIYELNLSERIPAYTIKETTIYASLKKNAQKAKLDVNTRVYIIGQRDDYYLVENKPGTVAGYVKMNAVGSKKVETVNTNKVVAMDWFDGGNKVVKRGGYATVYDIESGLSIRIKRMGGTNHADIEPATAEDTAILLKMCDGEFSWDSRAVILIADGKYVACAMNTMPHGQQTIYDNDYEGQCCLHMINSRTHGSDTVNKAHQKAIQKALDWAEKK